jgi:hypothetical protein
LKYAAYFYQISTLTAEDGVTKKKKKQAEENGRRFL